MGRPVKPNFCDDSNHNDGWVHTQSICRHTPWLMLALCVIVCTTAVYNKIWAWSRQMGRTMPVSQCYRADLKRKIFWCLLGEATPTEVTLSLVTGATMQSGTLQDPLQSCTKCAVRQCARCRNPSQCAIRRCGRWQWWWKSASPQFASLSLISNLRCNISQCQSHPVSIISFL